LAAFTPRQRLPCGTNTRPEIKADALAVGFVGCDAEVSSVDAQLRRLVEEPTSSGSIRQDLQREDEVLAAGDGVNRDRQLFGRAGLRDVGRRAGRPRRFGAIRILGGADEDDPRVVA
jgi:hypothetical protein